MITGGEAQFVDIGTGRIAYERRGYGPTLVFSHASLVDRRMWQAQMDALADEYEVIAYDRLGHGDSSPAPARVRHGFDLIRLLDALEIEHAALVGSSMGGGYSLDACLIAPGQARRMPESSSSHDHVANVLGALSLVMADRMNTATEAVAALGPSAPAALAALHEFLDGASMTQLSSVLGLTHSGTVRLVDRLAAEGLVDRGGSSDGRAVSLALTRRGQRLAAQVLQKRRISLDRALSELTPAEIRDLSKALDKMLTTITLTRAKARSTPTSARPEPWLCRLCEFNACGRSEGNCPVNNAVTTGTRS